MVWQGKGQDLGLDDNHLTYFHAVNHPAMNSTKIASVLLVLLCGLASADGVELNRPNVILIVTDDQGYGDMACHGNPWLKTPNLDRLYAESIRLEDYHVDPVCTPTRAALMSGRYSTRVGAWAVTEGRQLLGPNEVTMADVFADSGYRTGMFGKWHLGDAWPYAPRFRGFHYVVRHLAGGIDEIGNPTGNDFFDDTYYRSGIAEKIDGYCTDVFFGECQRFVSEESEQPFFAYLPLNAMQLPLPSSSILPRVTRCCRVGSLTQTRVSNAAPTLSKSSVCPSSLVSLMTDIGHPA